MALTFDDLPGSALQESQAYVDRLNRKLLARLRRNRVPAIGFVNEGKLDELNRAHQIRNLRRWHGTGQSHIFA